MEKIPELYIYDKKPSSNPNDILKSAKNFYTTAKLKKSVLNELSPIL